MSSTDHPFRPISRLLLALAVFVPAATAQSGPANTWRSIGPWGGDARSFASVPGSPEHLYLGGIANWVFESTDGGRNWIRKGHIGPADDPGDLMVDSLLVDAGDKHTLFAGVHRSYNTEGGLYKSTDGGSSWTVIPALKDKSVRSVAQAPSDPSILVVGALDGIFRTTDSGQNWERISPPPSDPLSREIHEVESLAIDPKKPDTIYAGTWHLPWKTTDGGQHWKNIKQGVIDDSDVFSIIIDPERSSTVYASACSGIYKSEDAGQLFHKIQGIPSTARRTRVLMQDTKRREIVYAGTTEGLYRTRDAGREWQRITDPNVIVNDIYIDPSHPGRVLIATDRSGVLVSDDNGATFAQSNEGFSARKVEALVADSRDPNRILAGIVNDKSYGGAFLTTDAGQSWTQIAEGLEGRDVFTFAQAKDGTILAGTNHGIFALEDGGNASHPHWTMRSTIVNSGTRIVSETVNGHKISRLENVKIPARALSSRIYSFDLTTDLWA
ncbi:MAG TPA: transcriptional regulator, partial [Acidobacteriaceae bacterium]